jgi:hypothetical protein
MTPSLALNLVWGLIDLFVIRAVARGARPARSLGIGAACALAAFVAKNGATGFHFHAMRDASYLVFLHAPIVLVVLAGLCRKATKRAALFAACALAIVSVGADAFLYEPHALVTTRYEVKSERQARIVVLSDFQAQTIGDYESSVLARIAALDPELLLLAGDYIQVNGPRRAQVVADFRAAFARANIHPRLGVFAVRGDVEPNGWEQEIFGDLGVTTAEETTRLDVEGIDLTLLSLRDSMNPSLALPKTDGTTRIALGHRPDYALGTGPAGLLIAGHTHGGQVQVPFFGPPLILSAVPRAWGAGGLFATSADASRSVLVTRGAGVEHADDAPPLRFNCRPEVVLLELKGPPPRFVSPLGASLQGLEGVVFEEGGLTRAAP